MILMQSADAVTGSFNGLWLAVMLYTPRILAALIVFLVGWIFATVCYRITVEIMRALRIDEALKGAGLHEAAKEAGIKLDASRFIGSLVMWFVTLVGLLASFQILGLTTVTVFLTRVVLGYIPQVIIASLIVILGAIVAETVRGVVTNSARAAGAHSAKLAGSVAKWAIWAFAILAALDQLGVASWYLQTMFVGLIVALSMAVGLAFGLGGRDAAARAIEKIQDDIAHDFD